MSMLYQDLTREISEEMLMFPGDPIFKKKYLHSLEAGSDFGLCEISMCNHIGTHVDFPAHVIFGGKSSSDYTVNDLIGVGVIIQTPIGLKSISADFLMNQTIQENDFVFFKTDNSLMSNQSEFTEEYVFIEPDAARLLIDLKVKIVGIDYFSVDDIHDTTLSVHHLLLSNNILIIENLEFKNVAAGRYHIFVMPIRIANMDGLPVRVVVYQEKNNAQEFFV